ncbi:MAG: hypothetical protein ORN54_07730 [Cyclobacteriaceae bacterium]|nr:hypothetical protein [Cyclobacteriaceae bacterium]
MKPSQLYLSSPDVDAYFKHAKDFHINVDAYFKHNKDFYITPADTYDQETYNALVDMGVALQPRIISNRQSDPRGNVWFDKYEFNIHKYSCGLDGFNPSLEIEGLECALNNPTKDSSWLIWELILQHASCIRGVIESSNNQRTLEVIVTTLMQNGNALYTSNLNLTSLNLTSPFGNLLTTNKWLPRGASGKTFVRPKDITLDELPSEFFTTTEKANKLAAKLGMKMSDEPENPHLEEEINKITGGDLRRKKLIESVMNASEEELKKYEEVKFAEDTTDNELPQQDVPNPERRARVILERIEQAPIKSSQLVNRMHDPLEGEAKGEARRYLAQYQNRCQICQAEHPVRKPNGEAFFQAVSCVNAKVLPKHERSIKLSLCPNHAEMYKANRNRTKINEKLKEIFCGTTPMEEDGYIRINLTEISKNIMLSDKKPCSLYFTNKHWHDIQVALKILLKETFAR